MRKKRQEVSLRYILYEYFAQHHHYGNDYFLKLFSRDTYTPEAQCHRLFHVPPDYMPFIIIALLYIHAMLIIITTDAMRQPSISPLILALTICKMSSLPRLSPHIFIDLSLIISRGSA